MKKKNSPAEAFLRSFHAYPTPKSLDIYLDDTLYVKDMLYQDFSQYKPLSKGEHHISITLTGESVIIAMRSIWISPQKIYTLIIAPDLKNEIPGLYLINDVQRPIPENHCLVRVGAFCEKRELIHIHYDNHPLSFKKISPHQISHYLAFEPGNYTIIAEDLEQHEILCELRACELKVQRIYTHYCLGKGTKEYPFQLLHSIDGSSFLTF